MDACPLWLPSLTNCIIPFHPGLGTLNRSDVFHNILISSPGSGPSISIIFLKFIFAKPLHSQLKNLISTLTALAMSSLVTFTLGIGFWAKHAAGVAEAMMPIPGKSLCHQLCRYHDLHCLKQKTIFFKYRASFRKTFMELEYCNTLSAI